MSNNDFVIEDGVLTKYNGAGGDVVIPEGVTKISDSAFGCCRALTSIVIPEGVTEIAYYAFQGCTDLKSVTIPESVTKIGYSAFYGCSNLTTMTISQNLLPQSQQMFGDAGKTIELILTEVDGAQRHVIASFRKVYYTQSWEYRQEYLIPEDEESISYYDRLIACGKYDGFAMNEDGRIKAMLFRLQDERFPVTEDLRSTFVPFLASKVQKAVKYAISVQEISYIRLLNEIGAITDSNRKRVKKLLTESKMPAFCQIAEELEQTTVTVSDKKQDDAENKFIAYLKKSKAKAALIKYDLEELPDVFLVGGTEKASPEYLQIILSEYIAQNKKKEYVIVPIADEAAAQLDRESLLSALREIYNSKANDPVISLPLFRYEEGPALEKLYREQKAVWYGAEAFANRALVLNDSQQAMFLAEKNKILDRYATVRGETAEFLRETRMYDFGFDKDGKKIFDLGVKRLEVHLNDDLTLTLCDLSNGKIVKSIPKKDVDSEVYEDAKKVYSNMKKAIKKAATTKNGQLFEDFLTGRTIPAEKWKESYSVNPLLRQVAKLVVWAQKGKTFILKDQAMICSDGSPYEIGRAPIGVAHPMEMTEEECIAWQKYFTSCGLKQPFAQVWEPVVNFASIRKERYSGIKVPAYRFKGQEKHGITFNYSFNYGLSIYMNDCTLYYDDGEAVGRHELDLQGYLVLGELKIEKESRWANHIIGLLDKWTIWGRIEKDDATVVDVLDGFTLAQITEFINLAIEGKHTNCTMALMEYKDAHFNDFDPMAEFTLD